MTTKAEKPSRLRSEINELAEAMHGNGTLNDADFTKITMRQHGRMEAATAAALSAQEIRAMREQAHMSQAVFARHLNVTVGYVSKLERGATRPSGPALVLLNMIRRKGIEALL